MLKFDFWVDDPSTNAGASARLREIGHIHETFNEEPLDGNKHAAIGHVTGFHHQIADHFALQTGTPLIHTCRAAVVLVDHIQAAAEAAYVKARPLDNTDFVMNWRKQMTRQYTLRALHELTSMD